MIEKWFQKTYPTIRERIPPSIQKEVDPFKGTTAAQFSTIVCILFIGASALIIITVLTEHYFLFLGLNIILALNIFTHPLQSILLKCYVPGLWTTLLLIIPYNIIVFFQLSNHGILNLTTVCYAFIVIIVFIPIFLFSHHLGRKWG